MRRFFFITLLLILLLMSFASTSNLVYDQVLTKKIETAFYEGFGYPGYEATWYWLVRNISVYSNDNYYVIDVFLNLSKRESREHSKFYSYIYSALYQCRDMSKKLQEVRMISNDKYKLKTFN